MSADKAEKIYVAEYKKRLTKKYKPVPGLGARLYRNVFGLPMVGTESSSAAVAVSTCISTIVERESAGFIPQLLNEIGDAEVERYIKDPAYGAQEKYNGERQVGEGDGSGNVNGVTKKGFRTLINPEIADGIRAIGAQVKADGEAIGRFHFEFDLLEYIGFDLRGCRYIDRYDQLAEILTDLNHPSLVLVLLARTEEEKRALIAEVRAKNGEGVVFKRLNAPYESAQIKFKFWKTGTFKVLALNLKRSVQAGVLEEDGNWFCVGNIPIPVNRQVPSVGDLIEVRYLYATLPGRQLFEATLLPSRTDVDDTDCRIGQLVYQQQCIAA